LFIFIRQNLFINTHLQINKKIDFILFYLMLKQVILYNISICLIGIKFNMIF